MPDRNRISPRFRISPSRFGLAPGLALLAAMGAACAPLARADIPDAVHPDYVLKEVPLPDRYRCMGLQPLADGRMAMAGIDDIGGGEIPRTSAITAVYIVTGIEGAAPRLKEVANSWKQIAGLVVADDKLYVSDRDGFYQILDLENPGDLKANRRLVVKWPDEDKWTNGVQWHQWVFTPIYKGGFFYAPYSGSIIPGGPSRTVPTSQYSGAFLKWDLSGKLEKFAGGLRSPNGANVGPNGDMFVADNQGSWLPSSTFMHMKQGKFYGHSNTYAGHAANRNWAEDLPYERPTAWLDHGNVRTSPSQPVYMEKGAYAGDWILGDVNNPGLVRIALDDVEGTYNGSVFWFSKGMGNSAINRMAWGKDGALYLGSLLRLGNWPSGDPSPLYRMTVNANPTVFDMRRVASVADGIEIAFTEAVDNASAGSGAFQVQQWNYVRQEGYGMGKGNAESRAVSAVNLSADGKRIHLSIAGLKEDYLTYIKLGALKSAAGTKTIYNNEAWFTLNKQSARAWDAAAFLPPAPLASSLAGKLTIRPLPGSTLEVTLDDPGPHAFALYALDGALLARVYGSGHTRQLLTAPSGTAFSLLEIRAGSESYTRPIALSE